MIIHRECWKLITVSIHWVSGLIVLLYTGILCLLGRECIATVIGIYIFQVTRNTNFILAGPYIHQFVSAIPLQPKN